MKKSIMYCAIMIMQTLSIVAQNTPPQADFEFGDLSSVTATTPEWKVCKHYILEHQENNPYYGWTEQDIAIYRILAEAGYNFGAERSILDEMVYAKHPELRNQAVISKEDIQDIIDQLNQPAMEERKVNWKKEMRKMDRNYIKEDRITKSERKEIDSIYYAFDNAYIMYIKNPTTVLADSLMQSLFIQNITVLKQAADSLHKEISNWKYDGHLIEMFFYGLDQITFVMEGNLAGKNPDVTSEEYPFHIRHVMSMVVHNLDISLMHLSKSDHKKPK